MNINYTELINSLNSKDTIFDPKKIHNIEYVFAYENISKYPEETLQLINTLYSKTKFLDSSGILHVLNRFFENDDILENLLKQPIDFKNLSSNEIYLYSNIYKLSNIYFEKEKGKIISEIYPEHDSKTYLVRNPNIHLKNEFKVEIIEDEYSKIYNELGLGTKEDFKKNINNIKEAFASYFENNSSENKNNLIDSYTEFSSILSNSDDIRAKAMLYFPLVCISSKDFKKDLTPNIDILTDIAKELFNTALFTNRALFIGSITGLYLSQLSEIPKKINNLKDNTIKIENVLLKNVSELIVQKEMVSNIFNLIKITKNHKNTSSDIKIKF